MNNRKSNKMKNKRRSNRMKNKRRSNRLKINKRSKRSKISRKSTRFKKTKMNKRNYKKRTIRRKRRSQRGGARENMLYVSFPANFDSSVSQTETYDMNETTWDKVISDAVRIISMPGNKLGFREGQQSRSSLTITVGDNGEKRSLVEEINKFLNGGSMDAMIGARANVGEELVNSGLAVKLDDAAAAAMNAKYILNRISSF